MKIRRPAFKPFHLILFSVLFLLISLLYSFMGIFFGLDFTDSFYHLNQALYPVSDTYLYPFFLSSLLIKKIIDMVGQEIINLRIINWVLLTASIFLPFIVLKVHRNKSEVLFYVSIVLVLYAPFNANILGYDTLSIFILSLLFSLSLLYHRSVKFYLIFLLALVCAAAVLIRLPNILAVPVIFFFLFVSEGVSKKGWTLNQLTRPGTFLIFTCLFIVLGYALYYSSWDQFVVAYSNSESHDLLLLFSNYFKDAIKLAAYIFIILTGLWGYRKLNTSGFPLIKESVLFLFFGLCLIFIVGNTKYSVNYSLFLVAAAIAFCLSQIYDARKEKLSYKKLILLLFLLFLFIYPFGSNTGLLKAYSLLVLVPFVLSISELRIKNYWFILTAALIPFAISTKIYCIYEDKNLIVLNEKLRLEKLSPIHTNRQRAMYLKQVDTTVESLISEGVQVYFYGDKAHIFHYKYPETTLDIVSFFQPVDRPEFFKNIDKAFQGQHKVAVFVINSYPMTSALSQSLLEQFLISMGFDKVQKGSVEYFLKISNFE